MLDINNNNNRRSHPLHGHNHSITRSHENRTNSYADNDLPLYHITLDQYTRENNANDIDNKSLNDIKIIDDLPTYEQFIISNENKQVQSTSF